MISILSAHHHQTQTPIPSFFIYSFLPSCFFLFIFFLLSHFLSLFLFRSTEMKNSLFMLQLKPFCNETEQRKILSRNEIFFSHARLLKQVIPLLEHYRFCTWH